MESNPFFSVVIPTKNRAKLIGDAIESVLMQNFDDFELIVSDNHNGEETIQVLEKYKNNPKVKIIRPSEELNMINHWEFATKHAIGKYVILLADRKVLYQGALKKIKETTQKYPDINAFSFGVQVYNEIEQKMGWCNPVGRTKKWKTNDLIENFLNTNIFYRESYDSFFPKTLNGMFKNSYATKIRDNFGNYFNNHGVTTPDYSSFFVNCALNEEIVYIGEKIILTQGEVTSNGRNFGMGKFHTYMTSLNLEDPYKFVPIKAPIIFNLLLVDFKTIQQKIGGKLIAFEENWENFFLTNAYEILQKEKSGLDPEGVSYFVNEWEKGLKEKNLIKQRDKFINEAKLQVDCNEISNSKLDKILKLKYHLRDYLILRYTKDSWINRIIPFKFDSVFHAAGFKIIKK
jgi:glycosyltransferase involved in cell wall biosynthesis